MENSYRVVIERGGIVRFIRKMVYRIGYRPKYGSLFHSPSLNIHYLSKKASHKREKDRRKNGWGGKF